MKFSGLTTVAGGTVPVPGVSWLADSGFNPFANIAIVEYPVSAPGFTMTSMEAMLLIPAPGTSTGNILFELIRNETIVVGSVTIPAGSSGLVAFAAPAFVGNFAVGERIGVRVTAAAGITVDVPVSVMVS